MEPSNKSAYKVRADVIHRLREQHGLTIDDLAKSADVSANTLRRWFKGGPATLTLLNQVAAKLGVSCDALIDREADGIPPEDPAHLESLKNSGWIIVTLRIPGDRTRFGEVTGLVERIEAFTGPAGKIELAFIRDGSIVVGLAMESVQDVSALITLFCSIFNDADALYGGSPLDDFIFDEVNQISFEAVGFDPPSLIAESLHPRIFHPKTFPTADALAHEFREHSDHEWSFVVLSEFYQGRIWITRNGSARWTIQLRVFLLIPDIDELIDFANQSGFPELIAGEIPDELRQRKGVPFQLDKLFPVALHSHDDPH